ncbi:MAG: MATE family efflux transporter [Fibrobacterota bacterium]
MARDLTTGNIKKQLFTLAGPVVGMSLLHHLYSIVDIACLGRLSKEAVAGVTLISLLQMITIHAASVITEPLNHFLSFSLGAKNYRQASLWLSRGAFFALCLGLFIFLIIKISGAAYITMMVEEEAVRESALTYLRIVSPVYIFTPLFLVLGGAIQTDGDTTTPFYISAATNFLNIFLNITLIFGLLFFPRLEVAGAALATLISRSGAMVALLSLFIRGFGNLKLIKTSPGEFFKKKDLEKFLKLGIPRAGNSLLKSVSPAILMKTAALFGPAVLAAYAIGYRAIFLMMLPALGLSRAVTSISGQSLGSGNKPRSAYSIIKANSIYLYYALPVAIFIMLAPGLISGIFTNDNEVAAYTDRFLRFLSVSLLFAMATMSGDQILSRAGDNVNPMYASFFGNLIIQTSLAFFLSRYTPLAENGIWIADPFVWIFQSIFLYRILILGKWKGGKLFEESEKISCR